jgi:hypothetical protein
MWRYAINKVINNFASSFSAEQVFGETLFVAPGQIENDLLREEFARTETGKIRNELSQRARILASKRTHARILQVAPPPQNASSGKQF